MTTTRQPSLYKNCLCLAALLIGLQSGFAQERALSKGDAHYDDMSYYEATLHYEQAFRNGAESVDHIRRLAESYLFIRDSENSAIWYAQLFKSDGIENKDRLNYAEVLRMNGKYEEADKKIQEYIQYKSDDERAQNLLNSATTVRSLVREGVFRGAVRPLSSNTETADWSPVFMGDELVFSSSRTSETSFRKYHGWDGKAYMDLFVGSRTGGGDVPNVHPFPKVINSRYHESNPTFDKSGTLMYFTRNHMSGKMLSRDSEGVNNLQIYSSHKVNDKWRKPKPFEYNDAAWSTGHPALSASGRELYFVSDRPGGRGGSDIYVCVKQSNGTWGEPRNLGPRVNTEGNEMSPYIHDDGTLFFASDGHRGLGGMDLFLTAMQGVDPGEVMNLGAPINTRFDELSLVLHETGEFGYFSSNRTGGAGDDDVYHLSLKDAYSRDGFFMDQEQPALDEEPVEDSFVYNGQRRVRATVKHAGTKDAIEGVELLFEDHLFSGAAAVQASTDDDGKLEVVLPVDISTESDMILYKEGFLPRLILGAANGNKTLAQSTSMEVFLTPVNEGVDIGEAIGIEPVYFEVESWDITDKGAQQLERVAFVLKRNPTVEIELASHTDSHGASGFNDVLSEMRAEASKDYLVSLGIEESRISARGYGESDPVNRCVDGVRCSEEEHQENRRTEFIVR